MKPLSDETTRHVAGVVGAVIFGAATVMELVRMVIVKHTWPGLDPNVDVVMTIIAVLFWVASAAVLATQSRKHRLIAIIGAFVMFSHGLLGTVARSTTGVVFVLLSLMIPVVERLAFAGKLTLGGQTEPPRHDPSSGPPAVY